MTQSLLRKFTTRADGWFNRTTGLGTSRDKQTLNRFVGDRRLDDTVADELYASNDVAAVICSAFPEYAIQRGFGVRISESEDIEEKERLEKDIQEEIERLDVVQKFFEADVWAHVFGAGVILIGADDRSTSLAEPLKEDNVRRLNHLKVYDRRRVQIVSRYTDPMSEKYDEPELYRLSPHDSSQGPIDVHESRLLIFDGVLTTADRKSEHDGWGDSFLQRCHQVVMQFGVSWDTLAHLIQNAGQGVFKMDKLIEAVAADEQDLIEKRMALMDMQRSSVRALTLDNLESFERQDFDFSGIKEGFELLMNRLSMVSREPITVIMGRSPAGENATGESDLELWFGRVETYRNLKVTPRVKRLISLIVKAKEGPLSGKEPEEWDIKYPNLRTPTPKDRAEIDNKDANTYHLYIQDGVLTKDEVALSKFGPDSDSEIVIDVEARIESMKEDPDEIEQYQQFVAQSQQGAFPIADPKADQPKTQVKNSSRNKLPSSTKSDTTSSKSRA